MNLKSLLTLFVAIVVKAYANLSGLSKHFKERGIHPSDTAQFWIGFTQRFPFMDFVDLGFGKELADNKIRGKFTPLYTNKASEEANRAL